MVVLHAQSSLGWLVNAALHLVRGKMAAERTFLLTSRQKQASYGYALRDNRVTTVTSGHVAGAGVKKEPIS